MATDDNEARQDNSDAPHNPEAAYGTASGGDTFNIAGLSAHYLTLGTLAGQTAAQDLIAGPIGEGEVRRLLRWYRSRPIDEKLKGILDNTNCVLLLGRPGTGRRTGAVNALVEKVGPAKLVDLGMYDGSDLARFDFAKRRGYLLDATAVQQAATRFTGPTLRQAQDRLTRSGSYLVVLGLDDWKSEDHFVRDWEGPTLEELVAARDFDPPLEIGRLGLNEILGDSPSVSRMVELLDRLAEGRSSGRADDQILDELPERERRRVRQWYSKEQSIGSWLLMSTLVFFSGISKKEFDALRLNLQEHVERIIPAGEDDRESVRSELVTPDPEELTLCMAEIRSQTGEFEGATLSRQLVCFQQESTAGIQFEEFWNAAPRRLRGEVHSWVAEQGSELSPDAMVRLAHSLAALTRLDSDSGLSILGRWAATPVPTVTKMAALAIDVLSAEDSTRPIAFALAREWAAATKVVPMQYAALYIYTGNVGIYQIRQAIRVYRYQYRHRPFWARATFAGFTEACISSPERALELAYDMDSLGVVKRGEIDDAAFALVGRWFIDTLTEPPLAVQLVVANSDASTHVASIAARSLKRSYEHEHWLEQVLPWADADEVHVVAAALRLLHDSISSIGAQQDPPLRPSFELAQRAKTVGKNLINYMDRARQRKNGPTALAVERCTAAIEHALRQLEGRPEVNE